jgi:hypothetical protein
MRRLKLFRNLRTAFLLVVVGAVVSGVIGLWWANHTGMPEAWRGAIEQQLAKQGANVKIGSLSYVPWRGVVAEEVRVFSNEEPPREVSRLERVVVQLDKTMLARGQLRISKLELEDARLRLQVNEEDPDSAALEVSGVSATVVMPGGRLLEVREARGRVAGVDVVLGARLLGFSQQGGGDADDMNRGERREFLGKLLEEFGKWRFDESARPVIRLFVEGDLADRSSLVARLEVQAKGLEKNGHVLDEISAKGELRGSLLTLTSLSATDSRGTFEGRLDYHLQDREGRFDVHSTLEVPRLLKAWFGVPEVGVVVFGGGQKLDGEGEFRLREGEKPEVKMTGRVRCESVMLRGVPFEAAESLLSWNGETLYLRDLVLTHAEGVAKGKAMIEWPLVRVALHTTLPVSVYRPFFVGQPLEHVLKDFNGGETEKVDVSLEGGFNLTDKYAWAYTGRGKVENTKYKGVPVQSADASFSLSHHELDFYQGTVVFDYRSYGLRKAFEGPENGTAKVGRIRFVAATKMVDVEEVEGDFWAAPMLRLFAPPIADHLEIYRFHRPPKLRASGVVDVTPQGRTSIEVGFSSEQAANYVFLGKDLTMKAPRGRVVVKGPKVTVDDLEFDVFDGPVVSRFVHDGKKVLSGDVSWKRLSVPEIGEAYDFEIKGGGLLTGRIEFSMREGKVSTMNGDGLLALEKAELFSVPMFGPLSPLISGVLGDRRAGFERAKDAFLTYQIKDGMMSSQDFRTATSSLVFTGDGVVNLEKRSIEMTIRMNARGLLGVLTLPLRPFYGLFQFRGIGPLSKPVWENVMFTSPPANQNDVLLNPPKARIVEE